MKLRAALAALLLAVGIARADGPAASVGFEGPLQQWHVPYSKRCIVIYPSRWDVLSLANLQTNKRQMERFVGNTFDAFEGNGGEVHFYNSAFFETNNAHRNLFATLGTDAPVACYLFPYGNVGTNGGAQNRYFHADSTTIQLVIVGGNGEACCSWSDVGVGVMDVEVAGGSASFARGSFLTPWRGVADTLWGQAWASSKRPTDAQLATAGVDKVVRMYRPQTFTGVSWTNGSDSTTYAAGTDSTCTDGDQMGPVWYAHFIKDGNGNTEPSSAPHNVWYVKCPQVLQLVSQMAYPQLLWAVLCRFTTVNPLRYSYEWDDMTDKPTDNMAGARATNATMDSTLQMLAGEYGIVMTGDVNPDHAVSYIRGTNPTYEVAWSGESQHYIKDNNVAWIHHAHDSTQARLSANIVGRYGGYPTGNAATRTTITAGALTSYALLAYAHRYASRFNPGNANVSQRFGIIQRFQYSDSLRQLVCPNCTVPNYMNFPGNQILPIGYKPRPTTANPTWVTHFSDPLHTDAGSGLQEPECSIDSLLYALSVGTLHDGTDWTTHVRKTLFLRYVFPDAPGPSSQSSAWAWGDASPRQIYMSGDRDTAIAESPFFYPGERLSSRLGGNIQQVRAVGSTLLGAASAAVYRQLATYRCARMLGLANCIIRQEAYNVTNGESATGLDFGSVGSAVSVEVQRNFNYNQAGRSLYQHPGPLANGRGSYDIDCYLRSIGTMVRSMDYLAARKATKCVFGWQVYDK